MRYLGLVLAAFLTLTAMPMSASAKAQAITLTVHDVDVYTVLQMLSMQSGRNIVPDNTSVHHDKITLSIRNVPFDIALHTVEMADGLSDYRVHGIIFVGTADAINRVAPNGYDDVQTRLFSLHYGDATQIAASLTAALPQGTVIVPDARTHSVLVTGNSLVVTRAGNIVTSLDVPLTGSASSALASQTFPLRFVKSADALTELQTAIPQTPGASILNAPDQNAIVVTGPPDMVATAGAILHNLDRSAPQVLYEVRVVDLEPINDNSNVGLIFSGASTASAVTNTTPPSAGQFAALFTGNSIFINATLNALITEGHGQTLASPRIAVLNNHEGNMMIGETRPISFINAQTNALQVQFINIGVQLKLTPTIGDNGEITTDLHPQFSSLLGLAQQGLPIISNRQVDTTLRVKDGESIVIAGLLQDVVSQTTSRIPFLSEIPVFGGLFKDKQTNHTKDEIVFVITPHIVRDGVLAVPSNLPVIHP